LIYALRDSVKMKRGALILSLLVIAITGGILLYSWNIQQKDKTGFQFLRKKKPSIETEKYTQLFSTEIGKNGTLMVLIPEGEFFMGDPDDPKFHDKKLREKFKKKIKGINEMHNRNPLSESLEIKRFDLVTSDAFLYEKELLEHWEKLYK